MDPNELLLQLLRLQMRPAPPPQSAPPMVTVQPRPVYPPYPLGIAPDVPPPLPSPAPGLGTARPKKGPRVRDLARGLPSGGR